MIRPTWDVHHQKCLQYDEGEFKLVARPCTGEARQLWSYDGQSLHNDLLINGQEVKTGWGGKRAVGRAVFAPTPAFK